jgi:phage terminase small subunit
MGYINMAAKQGRLTPRQKTFCIEYLKDFNGTQSVIRAGITKNKNSASVMAVKLLGMVSVQAYLNARAKKLDDALDFSLERCWIEIARIAFADIRKFYEVDGSLLRVSDLDDNSAAALAGIEEEEAYEHFGKGQAKPSGVLKKIKLWDKPGALRDLVKLKHKVAERIEVSNTERIIAALHAGRARAAKAARSA